MRARGHEHDAPGVVLELGGELLDEQQGRAHVLVQERVELRGRQLVETSAAAACVVHDERVERAELLAGRAHDARRRVGIGEVGLNRRLEVVGAPGLGGVVGRPAVREDVRAVLLEPPRDREADPRPAADAGDERPLQVVSTPTTSRTAAELDSSASRSSSERSSSTICSMPPGPSLTGTPM